MEHTGLKASAQYPTDTATDRTNRFLSPASDLGSSVLRERAASQPPRASVLSTPTTQHTTPGAGRGLNFTPRTSSGLNPNSMLPGMPQSVPTRSSSFSSSPGGAHANGFSAAIREHRGFASTFEDDESDVLSEFADESSYNMPSRGRSYAVDITRSRSQSLATTRQPPIGSPFTSAPAWPIASAATAHGGIARYSDYRAPPLSRYGSLGANIARSPGGHAAPRNDDISNISPFVRDVSQILLNDNSAFGEIWAGMPRNDGGGSGTTSRRHSVSVVQPRREIVGFHVPERDFPEEPTQPAPTFNARVAFNPSALLTDDELADDLGMLHIGPPGGHGRHASNDPLPGSIPIGGRSPPGTERMGGYRPLSLSIPQSSSFGGRQPGNEALGSPSTRGYLEDSYLGGGGSRAVVSGGGGGGGARYVPGQGIQYPTEPLASPTFRTQFSPSRAAPPGRQQAFGAPTLTRRASDAASAVGALDNVGKGVPLSAVPAAWPLYIVEFKAGRTDLFYITDLGLDIRVGDLVVVEADRGKDLGKVVNDTITLAEVEAFQRQQAARAGWGSEGGGAPAAPPSKEINPKMIYGKASPADAQSLVSKIQDEEKALQLCQSKVRQKKLPMEVVDAEYQWDRRKLTFYFIAEKRIDFRELVRELFRLYKTRIWMASLQGANYDQ